MASLTGQLVAETYKALLKVIDNDVLTASEKQITDGFGGGSNVFIDSNGFLRANKYKVTNGLATQFLKADGSLDANTYLTSITSAQVTTALGYTPVTDQRTLTINGVTYNLTANRSWTVEGTAAVWGNITGTLSNQTDLQAALNAKYNVPAGTISQYIRGDGTLATFPTLPGGLPTGGAAGQILAKIDATDYNTHWIDNYATQTKNEVKLGATLSKGAAVYVSSANGTNMIVSAASNTSEATSSKTFGLLETGGVTNDLVKCVTFGLLAGLDTSTASAGDPVWLGVNGALIFGLANKPVAPAHLVYIGVVTRVQSNNGEIFVNVQNGFELNEIHDVLIQSVANNQGLFYETSSGLWKNKSIATVLGYTPQAQLDGTGFVKASGTTITYDNSTYLTTTDAASTYQRLDKMVSNLLASDTEYPNSNAVINALALKANAANPVFTGNMSISGAEPKLFFVDTDNNPDYTVFIDSGIFYIYDQTNGATRFSIGTTGNISAGVGKSITADSFIKDGGTASQFLKADGTIDSNTYVASSALANYLLISTATSTYQRLDKMVSTLLPSATEYPNSNAVINALALKADAANPVFTGNMTISGAEPKLFFVDTDQNPDYTVFVDSGFFYIYDQTAGATRFQINSSGNISTGVGKSITAGSFIKESGTASQYLMADGSVSTGPSLSGYVPYTGATSNVDLGTRSLSSSLLFVNPVTSLASGAVIRTYNFGDPNWGFSNTQAAGANSDQYHVRVHGSGGTYGYLRQFQIIDASQSNNVRFAVNFDGSGAIFSTGLGLGGNMPTADRQFLISGTSFTTGADQYQAVINTTFANAASNLYGIYVQNNTNVNVSNSYAIHIAPTGGSGSVTNKWAIYQNGASDNNYFAGKVFVNTNTDAGFALDVNGLTRVKTLFPSYSASTLANQNSGIIWTNGTIGNAFGFVVQSGLFFQGDANASNNVFGVKAPTSDGSLGGTVFSVSSTGIVNARASSTSASLAQPSYFGNGEFMSTGAQSGYFWENRSGGVTAGSNWYGWYTFAGIISLYNGSTNLININGTSGATTFSSSVTVGGDINLQGGEINSTGRILMDAGPSQGFLFRTDNVAVSAMTILAGGNVGIGTPTPTGTYGKLSVAGGISLLNDNNGKLEIGRYSSSYPNSYIKLSSGSNALNLTDNADQFDIFTILNSGSVGINTTDPVNTAWGSATQTKQLSINATNYAVINLLGGARRYSMGVGDSNFYMAYDNNQSRHNIIVYGSGNIGINGASDAGYKLDVTGTIRSTGINYAANFYAGGSSYNTPNALVMAADTNWTYGIFHDGGVNYWMQVKYYGVGDDNRGFRVFNVNGNTVDFRVNGGGSGIFRGSVTATSFFESSDFRLKTLIEHNPIINGIENLQAKLYEKNGKMEMGYFAQDAELIMPYAVTKNADGFLSLSYREVHTAKIARLEQRVAELEKQLNLN